MSIQPETLFHNRYLLVNRIGSGGYSQVWLAKDTKAENMEVALKIFAPGQGLDTQGLSTFSREYATVFNFNHGNLLKPMHFDEFEGSPYLVLPYCSKGSVFSLIGETDEQTLALFMNHASDALEYLHRQDPPVIHQDIKPDNFLIDNEGRFLLSDFGISSKIRRSLTRSMGENASAGTLAYMPPEKFTADKLVIKAGDIFSLGATMYELLSGEWPFGQHGGISLNAGAEIPNLPEKFSPELNNIIRACMAKDPWNRPTAEKLKELSSHFIHTGEWKGFVSPAGQIDSKPEKSPIAEKVFNNKPKAKSSKGIIIALAAVAVIALVVLGISFFPDNSGNGSDISKAEADSLAAIQKVREDSLAAVEAENLRIEELKQAESQAWTSAQQTNTRAAFDDYLQKYPEGQHVGEANIKIDELIAASQVSLSRLMDSENLKFNYVGEVLNGKPHGRGKATYFNGNVYEGEYRNGLRQGRGTLVYADGRRFVGTYRDDKRQGRGTLTWPEGHKYEGDFTNDEMTGRGTYTFADGAKYNGDFVNLMFTGNGTMTYANGDKYTGQFRDDKRHGEGTYTIGGTGHLVNCPGCKKYVGSWHEGDMNGTGRCYDENNRLIYEGPFKFDKPTASYPNR